MGKNTVAVLFRIMFRFSAYYCAVLEEMHSFFCDRQKVSHLQ